MSLNRVERERDAARAEISELRSTARKIADTSVLWQDQALEARAEVERLRAALGDLDVSCRVYGTPAPASGCDDETQCHPCAVLRAALAEVKP